MDTDTQPESPKPIQVMDIQPPKQPEVILGNTKVEEVVELSDTDGAIILPQPTESMDIAQAEEAPSDSGTPIVAEAEPAVAIADAPEPATTDAPETHEPETPTPLVAKAPEKAPSHRGPMLPIAVALVVAIALAVSAVMVYSHQKDKPKATANTTATVKTPQTQAATAKPTDVDDASKAVDSNLNTIDDSKDFDSGDLSNTSLGL